eukprot:9471633-Pyramimonas_sp.AAC.1
MNDVYLGPKSPPKPSWPPAADLAHSPWIEVRPSMAREKACETSCRSGKPSAWAPDPPAGGMYT